MRTFEIITKPGKSRSMSMLSEYFRNATMDAKCMYNTANFYIRLRIELADSEFIRAS